MMFRIVDSPILPGTPEDSDPCAGEYADGVGVLTATCPGPYVDIGGLDGCVSRITGETGQRRSQVVVAGPLKHNAAVLAEGVSNGTETDLKSKLIWLLLGFGVVPGPSRNQAGDEGAEQRFAASASVVHELEEAEVERQLVLRHAPVRAQPGAQQRPEAFHGVDVDLAEAVAVLVAGILAAPMADRLVLVAPGWQASVDAILVRVDEGAFRDCGLDDRLDRGLLHVGQHVQDHLAAALDQAEDGWLVLRQRAAARCACQPATPSEPPLLATAAGWPLCPATT